MKAFPVRPQELGTTELTTWRSMQRQTQALANPFLTPEFALAVGEHRPGTRVAVLIEDQEVIGFFPFEKRRLNTAVPLCGWLSPCQGVIHSPAAEWDCQELLRECNISAWKFDNLIADQQSFKPFQTSVDPAPIMDISEGFPAYYAKLHGQAPRMCREMGRKTRKLGHDVGDLRLVSDSRDPAALRTLMAWKSEQYRRTNHVDRFSQPWLVGLLESLLNLREDRISGQLSVLYAGDSPVAAEFGLRCDNLLVGWFTGYAAQFSKYSPGIIHLLQMTEALAAAGVTTIHMGKGSRNYTKLLKSQDMLVAKGIVTSSSLLGSAHRASNATARWAVKTVRKYDRLHDAADRVLRHSGVSSVTYGRI
ncbi:MAG: GNAT family N-acetyltransferase [Streptosporangiaceae bacterium]|jgi:CelD/BcsL family acetyltransferase involved in cellulose biosynthesis